MPVTMTTVHPTPTQKTSAFTLVEILITVIIIGLLAGIAVMKLGASRDLADINYLKATIQLLDTGIQRVIAVEGTFPDVPDGTPADRTAFILEQLDNRDIFVYLENTHPAAFAKYLQPILASSTNNQSRAAMIENMAKARKGQASGVPTAREIVIMPIGVIVYPEAPQFAVNDPENPHQAFYYASYWLPKEVEEAVAYFRENGTYRSEEDRLKVLNNIALSGFDAATILSMIENADSATNASLNKQLLDYLANPTGTLDIAQEDLVELLEQGLNGPNAALAISQLDLAKVEWNKLSLPTIQSILATRSSDLQPDQIDALLTHLGSTDTSVVNNWGSTITNPNVENIVKSLANANLSDAQFKTLLESPYINLAALNPLSNKLIAKINDGSAPADLVDAMFTSYLKSGNTPLGYTNFEKLLDATMAQGLNVTISEPIKQALLASYNSAKASPSSGSDHNEVRRIQTLMAVAPELVTAGMLEAAITKKSYGANVQSWEFEQQAKLAAYATDNNMSLSNAARAALVTGFTAFPTAANAEAFMNSSFTASELQSAISAAANVGSYTIPVDVIQKLASSPAMTPAIRNNLFASNDVKILAAAFASFPVTDNEVLSGLQGSNKNFVAQGLAANGALSEDQVQNLINYQVTNPNPDPRVGMNFLANANLSENQKLNFIDSAFQTDNPNILGLSKSIFTNDPALLAIRDQVIQRGLNNYLNSGDGEMSSVLREAIVMQARTGSIDLSNYSPSDKELIVSELINANFPTGGNEWGVKLGTGNYSTTDPTVVANAQSSQNGQVLGALLSDPSLSTNLKNQIFAKIQADSSEQGNSFAYNLATAALATSDPAQLDAQTRNELLSIALSKLNPSNPTEADANYSQTIADLYGKTITDSSTLQHLWDAGTSQMASSGTNDIPSGLLPLLSNPNISQDLLNIGLNLAANGTDSYSAKQYQVAVFANPNTPDYLLDSEVQNYIQDPYSINQELLNIPRFAAKVQSAIQDAGSNYTVDSDPIYNLLYGGGGNTSSRESLASDILQNNYTSIASNLPGFLATDLKPWVISNVSTIISKLDEDINVNYNYNQGRATATAMLADTSILSILTLQQKRTLESYAYAE